MCCATHKCKYSIILKVNNVHVNTFFEQARASIQAARPGMGLCMNKIVWSICYSSIKLLYLRIQTYGIYHMYYSWLIQMLDICMEEGKIYGIVGGCNRYFFHARQQFRDILAGLTECKLHNTITWVCSRLYVHLIRNDWQIDEILQPWFSYSE